MDGFSFTAFCFFFGFEGNAFYAGAEDSIPVFYYQLLPGGVLLPAFAGIDTAVAGPQEDIPVHT
jgi:hypothetical protein